MDNDLTLNFFGPNDRTVSIVSDQHDGYSTVDIIKSWKPGITLTDVSDSDWRTVMRGLVDKWRGKGYRLSDTDSFHVDCPFTHAHTRHWCGHKLCRDS